MNIGNTVKYPINKHVYISIWNASHDLITITPFESICYIITILIQAPINESIWITAYDGVCDYVYEI